MKLSRSEMTWFGLALMSLILGVFQYLMYKPVSTADSIQIDGQLTDKPVEYTQGGDMPYHFVIIQLDNRKKAFRLKDCSYQLTDTEQLLNLNKGALINLTVDKDELDTEDEVPVYAFSTADENVGFTLAQFNRCYVDYWKRIIPFAIAFLLTGTIGFIKRSRGRK